MTGSTPQPGETHLPTGAAGSSPWASDGPEGAWWRGDPAATAARFAAVRPIEPPPTVTLTPPTPLTAGDPPQPTAGTVADAPDPPGVAPPPAAAGDRHTLPETLPDPEPSATREPALPTWAVDLPPDPAPLTPEAAQADLPRTDVAHAGPERAVDEPGVSEPAQAPTLSEQDPDEPVSPARGADEPQAAGQDSDQAAPSEQAAGEPASPARDADEPPAAGQDSDQAAPSEQAAGEPASPARDADELQAAGGALTPDEVLAAPAIEDVPPADEPEDGEVRQTATAAAEPGSDEPQAATTPERDRADSRPAAGEAAGGQQGDQAEADQAVDDRTVGDGADGVRRAGRAAGGRAAAGGRTTAADAETTELRAADAESSLTEEIDLIIEPAPETAVTQPIVVREADRDARVRVAVPERAPTPESEERPFWMPVQEMPRGSRRPPERGRPGRPPKPPRRPASGLLALLVLALLATFFAWVSAEPLWLAVGHGDEGTATVTECTGDGVSQRCLGEFTAASGAFTAERVRLLGVGDQDREGTTVAARMVGSDSGRAYVDAAAGVIHLRWGLGMGLVLLCGVGIVWATGTLRLETRRARRRATLAGLAGPVLVAVAFLAATF